MSATDVPRASMATPGRQTGGRQEQSRAFDRDGVGGARLSVVDMRVGALLVREARRRALTRMFGIPGHDQSFLVTITVLGAAATVLRGVVARPLPHPSGGDLAIGGAVVNTGLRGIAGAPSANIPLAGALIAIAVLSHSLRPIAVESVREIRILAHGFGTVFGAVFGVRRG